MAINLRGYMTIRLFFLLIAIFAMQSSHAVTVDNLYKAEIVLPLIDSEQKVIEKAYDLAVEQVLTKVSGDEAAVQKILPLAKKSVAKWVAQHSITDEQNLIELDDAIYSAKKVVVSFYSQSIDQFLFEHDAPVWGKSRPSVLLWMIEQKQFQRQIAGVQSPSDMLAEITRNAEQKGVPIYAPLQDDVDRSALTASDLWGFFETTIREASRRYETDTISVLKVIELDQGYEGTLQVLFQSEPTVRIELQGQDELELAEKATQLLAKLFSDRYASRKNSGEETQIDIQVTNIVNHEALDQVQGYLKKLGIVQDVYPSMVDGSVVRFTVSLNDSLSKLINIISLDSLIIKESAESNGSNELTPNLQTYKYNG
ncbi:DUF2066 domain-containing protein [Marinomonas agarivorans]|nr:DUF2066 domain-containing protein [Marinomonas agarivorans]